MFAAVSRVQSRLRELSADPEFTVGIAKANEVLLLGKKMTAEEMLEARFSK